MTSSVLGTVTNWFVGGPKDPPTTSPRGGAAPTATAAEERDEGQQPPSPSTASAIDLQPATGESRGSEAITPDGGGGGGERSKGEKGDGPEEARVEEGENTGLGHGSLDVDLQEVSEKAIHAAKEWGSYLFSFGKAATEQVAKTAKQLKDTVEEKTILGEFSREQEKFVTVNREKKKQSEAAVAPWIGYNEEELMKTQILALSKDKRNLLRNPPSGVQFYFDYDSIFPIAMVMLDEDPNLKVLRFELVPKQIKEELFWRNYFYRVSLIKQSTQLTSMAQPRGSTVSSSLPASDNGSSSTGAAGVSEREPEELTVGSPSMEQEFVSDAFQDGDLIDEELKKEMHQLGVTDDKEGKPLSKDDIPEWEKELQAELQEYEVVGDDENNIDDADLEREIMKQIEAESKQT